MSDGNHERRMILAAYARVQRDAHSGNDLAAFVETVREAIRLGTAVPYPHDRQPVFWSFRTTMAVEDLKYVLIGNGLRNDNRGTGRYFVGRFGSSGFRKDFQEPKRRPSDPVPNQVAHAMAGIYIGFLYGRVVETYALWNETVIQDIALYNATFPIGRSLADPSLPTLPSKIRSALGP